MTGLYAVITTIQPPTASVRRLADRLDEEGAALVVAGDAKGPAGYDLEGADGAADRRGAVKLAFLSLQDQLSGPFDLARRLPTGHYSRKNIGYLHAIAAGAACIYETDDDNAPRPQWRPRTEWLESTYVVRAPSRGDGGRDCWANAYSYFTKELIWPRGLPLDAIREPLPPLEVSSPEGQKVHAPVQQGLANNSPDVDAIWRLVLDRPFSFEDGPSVFLPAGVWCPFNSQSTWWWPVAYPLLYIPSHCSFRMCDIWRGLVAQRCLWELGPAWPSTPRRWPRTGTFTTSCGTSATRCRAIRATAPSRGY